ncbi:hypothetical protein CKALI_05460 [Corynebacterium kalinowskii]|uniref:Uncharacterized protein n=1 Tax=Corynebacterium kalinowskii TaxID=2675216 RepID=A0A6B8VA12_9CORY|nr:hypothetical protein [Corynebacterium kalinowskii]QGU01962.1 hypothetical protein CKALI_05460 [Corynebacterium kalinowskii]
MSNKSTQYSIAIRLIAGLLAVLYLVGDISPWLAILLACAQIVLVALMSVEYKKVTKGNSEQR